MGRTCLGMCAVIDSSGTCDFLFSTERNVRHSVIDVLTSLIYPYRPIYLMVENSYGV